MHAPHDIVTQEDCRQLVDAFYGEARRQEAYHGNPLAKHLLLKIDRRHFDRWLGIWTRVVDEHFRGPRADMAKARAGRMADLMVERIGAFSGRSIA